MYFCINSIQCNVPMRDRRVRRVTYAAHMTRSRLSCGTSSADGCFPTRVIHMPWHSCSLCLRSNIYITPLFRVAFRGISLHLSISAPHLSPLQTTQDANETQSFSISEQTGGQQDCPTPIPNLPCNRQRRYPVGRPRNHSCRFSHRKRTNFPIYVSTTHIARLHIRLRW